MTNPPKIPVVIITGFLGSGKTTVLNHLVKQPGMSSTAVIINEFGEIGIDHLLVETSTEEMIELNNGCICCTVRGDLVDKLGSLAMWLDAGKIPPVDRVIVETTGLADPAPIMHTLMTDENILNRFNLDKVVTVVDAITGLTTYERFDEAVRQTAIADKLLLSKGDLVATLSDDEAFDRLKQKIKELNPRVEVLETINGEVSPDALFSEARDDAEAAFADFSDWLSAAADNCHDKDCTDHSHSHHHREGVTSFIIELDEAVDSEPFNDFLQELAIEFGEYILRMKGILNVAGKPEQPAVFHGVQHVFFPVSWLEEWPDEERTSKLVFITQGLDPEVIKNRFAELYATVDS